MATKPDHQSKKIVTTAKDTSKYSDAIRSGQLKILFPTLKDLREAVKKDTFNIKSKIA